MRVKGEKKMHLTVKFIILQAKKQRELCVRAQIRVKVLTVELETESKVKLDDASERPCPCGDLKDLRGCC